MAADVDVIGLKTMSRRNDNILPTFILYLYISMVYYQIYVTKYTTNWIKRLY